MKKLALPVLLLASCGGDGTVADATDCDDTDPAVHPGADETVADGVDGDCDGAESCYRDGDRDGYGGTTTVSSIDFDLFIRRGGGAATVVLDADGGDPWTLLSSITVVSGPLTGQYNVWSDPTGAHLIAVQDTIAVTAGG